MLVLLGIYISVEQVLDKNNNQKGSTIILYTFCAV